jgi:hypothetical protein
MSNADAGIDDERVSPRLTSFTKQNFRRCLFSPFCHLPLIAAAKVSKEGSMSAIRVWPSRCSASVERPRRAHNVSIERSARRCRSALPASPPSTSSGAASRGRAPSPESISSSGSKSLLNRRLNPPLRLRVVRLANLSNFALDRLSRYGASLWRQARQILYAPDALDRRKPQERRRYSESMMV